MQQGTMLISNGDFVQKGDLIGYIGRTGNAQTNSEAFTHLHFARYGSSAEDPSNDILTEFDKDSKITKNPCQ